MKSNAKSTLSDREHEADGKRASNRAAVVERLERRAQQKEKEEARAGLANLRGKTGRALGDLTTLARRREESRLPAEVERALLRLQAATTAAADDVASVDGDGDGQTEEERVAAEAMEEMSRAMDSTLHEWSCAETVLALGALASALPTRQGLMDHAPVG